MFSKFFIERPILSNVLAIVIVLVGDVAFNVLPVAQYPPITPPVVQVTTRYPGASANTLINTVALPIEQQVNGVERMLYMQSTSASEGTYNLQFTFDIGTDTDFAQVLVQNRVASAMAQLPPAVQSQGVTTQKRSTAILQIINLTSPDGRYDSLYMSNYATINLEQVLARLPGVGNVTIFGIGQYSMRIWLDPNQLQTRSLNATDVINAIQQQNVEVPAGQIGMPPAATGQNFQYTVNVQGRLADVAEFENIIVKVDPNQGGRITRIRDVARVELGAQTYSQFCQFDGKPSAGIAIYQLPDANALQVAKEVRATMAELGKSFPQGLTWSINFDTTLFVTASIEEVYKTLIEAGILVLIVIMVFLQDWRAMLVPATTVPVTIIGAFAAMAALGFSINLSTLFGIVLAIGIVVDDAIVIVEGAAHHIDQGLTPHDAAIQAMKELFAPIVGITLVLMSVFIPAAFMPGITGQLYRQFALVIAATALISAVNAATLKPTQCALWLKPHKAGRKNFFYRGFNAAFAGLERFYTRIVGGMVKVSWLMVIVAFVLIGVVGWGLTRVPTGFLPTEDQGYLMVAAQLPDGASLERTNEVMNRLDEIALKTPGVDHLVTIGGVSLLDNSATLANAGVVYVILKDWSKRTGQPGQDLRSIVQHIYAESAKIESAITIPVVPPPILGLGNSNGFQMQLELKGGSFDYAKLQQVANTMVANAKTQSGIARTATTFRAGVPQIVADIDRVKAESLGVSVGDVFSTIQSYVGSTYVNQIVKFGQTFQVYVQADAGYRVTPQDIRQLYVRNRSGQMVPIGTVAEIEEVTGPALLSLYNLYPTALVQGVPSPGFSSGQALGLMDEVAKRTLPPDMGFEWTAMSYQENAVGSQAYFIFALAIVLVYLVLAGQYESWLAPAAVIFAVPLALLGTVGALMAIGIDNNLYTQIGLVLLIALGSKNAILIVEFARELHFDRGMSVADAAVEAARLRLRPILMTSFAFILGVLPLVFASGAGAASRKSIGIAVSSGMLASTCLATLFVPSFWVVTQRLSNRKAKPAAAAPAAAVPEAPPAE